MKKKNINNISILPSNYTYNTPLKSIYNNSIKIERNDGSFEIVPINTKKNIRNNNTVEKRNNIKVKSELINHFLELLMIIKVYHWKTYSYPEHKATDKLYESLNENIDKFVEIMLGKNNSRLNMKGKSINLSDPNTKTQIKKIINSYRILLEEKINKYIDVDHDTDLLNIRDEILGDLNQFLFLLSLH